MSWMILTMSWRIGILIQWIHAAGAWLLVLQMALFLHCELFRFYMFLKVANKFQKVLNIKWTKNTFANLIFTERKFLLAGDCLVRICLGHCLLGLETLLTYNMCKSMLTFIKILHIWVLHQCFYSYSSTT